MLNVLARFLLLWAISSFPFFFCSEASVHEYVRSKLVLKGNAFFLHGGSEGLYASVPEKNSSMISNGESFIRFEKITFRRTNESAKLHSSTDGKTGLVQAVLFEVEDRESIGGSAYGGQRAVCCTADLAKLGACTQGEVIHRPSVKNSDWPKIFSTYFEGDNLYATMETDPIPITRTGMYNLYFFHCDPNLRGLLVDGKTVWKNPTGYLPGRMAPLMNFYGVMAIAFVLLGIIWFSQYVRFWREVLQLQNCITVVIALGMFEMALWYFEYAAFNASGERPTGITIWAVTCGMIKRTVSRVIILMVSMGYGVVRSTLGGLTSKARLFLVLPVALLDAFFILWIFKSLSKTIEKLQMRRLTIKLDVYRKFTNALAVVVIISVGWICYELYFKSMDIYNERWQSAWIIPAFWQVLSFSLLCVICVLWAPSQNSMRYAYSVDAGDDFDKEDTTTLVNSAREPVKGERSTGLAETEYEDPLLQSDDAEEDKRE